MFRSVIALLLITLLLIVLIIELFYTIILTTSMCQCIKFSLVNLNNCIFDNYVEIDVIWGKAIILSMKKFTFLHKCFIVVAFCPAIDRYVPELS